MSFRSEGLSLQCKGGRFSDSLSSGRGELQGSASLNSLPCLERGASQTVISTAFSRDKRMGMGAF